jgi:RNA polymerase sigma-70 factor, ECF subfamily
MDSRPQRLRRQIAEGAIGRSVARTGTTPAAVDALGFDGAPSPATMSNSPADPRPNEPDGAFAAPFDVSGADGAQVHESGERSDHELIRLAQAGNEEAFGELVLRHEGRAFRVARQMVPDSEEARDLAQEAFLRVYRSLDRFDFKHEFTTWLYRIVTNLGIDHLRRRRPIATGGTDEDGPVREEIDESAPAPSARLERHETARLVRACIDTLPEHFRVVLALRELEGLTSQEISRIVGATPVTVRWRLHRARKIFAEQWERLEERRAAGGLLEWARPERLDALDTDWSSELSEVSDADHQSHSHTDGDQLGDHTHDEQLRDDDDR